MDERSEAERTNANAIAVQEHPFPYDGIFSPHGFLATISSISQQDPGDDSSAKVDSQCDDQGQLPPAKKLKIPTTSKKMTEVVQSNDVPPTEVAFGIDHILEKILRSLETADLLKCRLVCHRWCVIATPELQKTVELSFHHDHDDRLEVENGRDLKLSQLTRLLKETSEITRSRFPCQKFKFDTTMNASKHGTIRSTQLTNFLDIYGIHIQSLCINCYVFFNENFALAELQKLLTEQMPNLKYFSLGLGTSKGKDADLINNSESNNQEAYENKSLKIFYMRSFSRPGEDLFKVLEGVLQLAPNLEELVHDHMTVDGEDKHLKYRYFRKPLNRLYLLKEVHLGYNPQDIESVEKIVGASLDTPGTLKLRQFSINSGLFNFFERLGETELACRFVAVMNYLLNCSWDTLETIKWESAIFLKGMEWGKVMSKVKAIKLFLTSGSHDANIFPPGLELSTTFPKLRTHEIRYNSDEPDFMKLVNRFNPEKEVLNSVKLVLFRGTYNDPTASAEASELLRARFPSAEIQYSS